MSIIEELEQKYRSNNSNGIQSGTSSVQMISGHIPVLIDAPHAVRQYRDGSIKVSDAYTGSLTEYLCALTGAHGCIRSYNDMCDPNFDTSGKGRQYRDDLGKYCREHNIRLVIDLHGTADSTIVCEIGTNKGRNLCGHTAYATRLKAVLSELGPVLTDQRFRASAAANISRTLASQYGIPSIQIEIGSTFRKSEEKRMQFIEVFSKYIMTLATLLQA